MCSPYIWYQNDMHWSDAGNVWLMIQAVSCGTRGGVVSMNRYWPTRPIDIVTTAMISSRATEAWESTYLENHLASDPKTDQWTGSVSFPYPAANRIYPDQSHDSMNTAHSRNRSHLKERHKTFRYILQYNSTPKAKAKGQGHGNYPWMSTIDRRTWYHRSPCLTSSWRQWFLGRRCRISVEWQAVRAAPCAIYALDLQTISTAERHCYPPVRV